MYHIFNPVAWYGLACFVPHYLILAIWIKLDSKGQVFYKQFEWACITMTSASLSSLNEGGS